MNYYYLNNFLTQLFVHVLVYISLRAGTLSTFIMEQRPVYSRCSTSVSCMGTFLPSPPLSLPVFFSSFLPSFPSLSLFLSLSVVHSPLYKRYYKPVICICKLLCALNIFYFILFFLAVLCGMWDLSFSDQGSNSRPLQWNCGVLTTGPPGRS